ncbi:recombinase RecA [Methanococcoides sp. SA1]|nr:recombinase RecA [Methanococcoides sp. SA1]
MPGNLSMGVEVIDTPRVSQQQKVAVQELPVSEEAPGKRKLELCAVPKPEVSTKNQMPEMQTPVYTAPIISPTGIYVLDRSLGGGLPLSSMIYFSADPRSMSEVFLYEFTQSRKTYYFTTGRRPKYIQRDIINQNLDPSRIIFVDIYSEYYFTPVGDMIDNVGNEYIDSKIIEFTEYNLQNILGDAGDEDINIIFDNFTFFMNLNVNPGLLKRLTNIIYENSKETNSMTYLYALKGSQDDLIENEVLNTSDVIFDVKVDHNADHIVSKLTIPKIRGMVPNSDVLKFNISEGVQIDTSKDIA